MMIITMMTFQPSDTDDPSIFSFMSFLPVTDRTLPGNVRGTLAQRQNYERNDAIDIENKKVANFGSWIRLLFFLYISFSCLGKFNNKQN